MVAQKPRYSELMESGVLYFVARGKVHNDHGYQIGGGNKSTKSITSRKLLSPHIFVGGLARRLEISSIVKVARDAGKPLFCWLLGKRNEAREFHKQAQDMGILVYRELYRAVEYMVAVLSRKSVR